MTDLSIEIRSTLKELEKLEAIDRHFSSVSEQESALIVERDLMEKQLAKELKDVEKLEGLGIKSVFYNILGNKASQLEKERQEYLELSLKHTQHLKSIKLIQYEKELLEGKMVGLGSHRIKLASLKKDREKEILTTSGNLRERLIANINDADKTSSRISMLAETMNKADAAKMSLNKVIKYFKKAKDWGNWDMAGRNSRYSDYNKHSAINNAVTESNRSNILLQSLSKDLDRAGYTAGHLNIGFQSFRGFMDVLFDNLITDWIIQGKIKNALSQTVSVRDKVLIIIKSLKDEKNKLQTKLEQLDSDKHSILES